jgi:hypothetical protein
MNTDHGHESGDLRNPSVKYDKSDLGARGILIFFFVLLLAGVAVQLVVLGLYAGMTKIADQHAPEISPLAPKTVAPRAEILTNTADVNVEQFPQPRLLIHPSQKGLESKARRPGEMTKFLRDETKTLTAKPWQDEQGNVHLPIEQAMKEVVPRLPVRANPAPLPNYPGAGQDYSHPVPPYESVTAQNAAMSGEGDQFATRQMTGGAAAASKTVEGR